MIMIMVTNDGNDSVCGGTKDNSNCGDEEKNDDNKQ